MPRPQFLRPMTAINIGESMKAVCQRCGNRVDDLPWGFFQEITEFSTGTLARVPHPPVTLCKPCYGKYKEFLGRKLVPIDNARPIEVAVAGLAKIVEESLRTGQLVIALDACKTLKELYERMADKVFPDA